MEELGITDLHIAIVPATEIRLSNKILTVIKNLIRSRHKECIKHRDILVTPRFVSQPVIERNILTVICLDDVTKLWVEEVVPKLIGIPYDVYFDGRCQRVLKIPPIKIALQRDIIKLTKCRLLIPSIEYGSFNDTVDVLAKMNPDAAVEKWIFDKNVKRESPNITVSVDVPSDLIPCINKQLYYGLGRATFQVLDTTQPQQAMAGKCHTDSQDSKGNLEFSSIEDLGLTDLHIAIVTSNRIRLSNKILIAIQDLIRCRHKDCLRQKDILVTPRFVTQPVIERDMLTLICLDNATKLWVEEVVPQLIGILRVCHLYLDGRRPTVRIPPIKVARRRDLINLTKCRILIPNSEYESLNETLDILGKMNPDAAVEKWTFDKNVKRESENVIVNVDVPGDLIPCINDQLYYGLGRATLEVLEQKEKSHEAAKLEIAKPE